MTAFAKTEAVGAVITVGQLQDRRHQGASGQPLLFADKLFVKIGHGLPIHHRAHHTMKAPFSHDRNLYPIDSREKQAYPNEQVRSPQHGSISISDDSPCT